jgi:hypothetical protein
MTKLFPNDDGGLPEDGVDDDGNHKKDPRKDISELTLVYTVICLMRVSAKFCTCAVVSENRPLVEDKKT